VRGDADTAIFYLRPFPPAGTQSCVRKLSVPVGWSGRTHATMKGNPQPEDGTVRIATELWEAITRTRVPGEAMQCLMFIIRKTYGWQKKEDKIPLVQFVEATGIPKPRVCRSLAKLRGMNIIAQKGNKLSINKFYSTWRPLPKKATLPKKAIVIAEKGNESLPKKAPSIDKIDTSSTDRDGEIVKWLDKKGKNNPRAYLSWVKTQASEEAISKAWKEAKRQNVGGVSGFVDRCREIEDGLQWARTG